MLAHGLHATVDDHQFLYLLSHGVSSTLWWTYASIWVATGCGLLLGGLGGLAAGPGGPAARSQPGFWLMLTVAGVFGSALNLLVTATVYGLLAPILQNVATRGNLTLPYPSGSALIWPAGTALAWLLLCQLAAWLVVRRTPASRSMAFLNGIMLPVLILLLLSPILTLFWAENLSAGISTHPACGITLIVVALVLFWLTLRVRLGPLVKPPRETPLRRLSSGLSAFFARAGSARVAAWTLLIIDLLLALLVFLAARAAFPLPWLAGGLALGLLLAVLGVRDTWKVRPAADGEPAPTGTGEFLTGTLLSQLLPVMLSVLNSLASVSLVLIPVVMIATLMLHDEAQVAAAAGGVTLVQVVQVNYLAQASLLPAAALTTAVAALLVAAAHTLLLKLRARRLPPESSGTS
jgi:hypothetical protein